MRYSIYRGEQIVLGNFRPEGNVTARIMGEETASLSFTLPNFIEFHIGDRITIYNKDYFVSTEPIVVKKSTREFQYSLLFYSLKYKLADFQMFFYDNENELTLPDFDIMGNADTCLDIVLANANRADNGWTKGVVDATEVKNVTFSDCNLLEAISKIAEEFKLEYWIDSDKSIHFTERKPVSGYSFEYGKAKGLKNITRSVLEGGKLVTRLYVKGSDRNLPKNYRGGQKKLRIDVPCLEKNINIYGLKEHTENFDDIYPKRVGTVTAVDENDPNRFTDANLDFDLNAYNEYGTTVLLNGVAVKVIFQTGQLAGYRLELIEAGGFNSATKTFYLNPNKDEKDLQIPSAVMRPAVGDKYILEDLMMPEAYVLLAESELKTKGQEYLDQNSKDRYQYAAESDIILFKNLNINIQLGTTVHFVDTDFNLDDDIRITGLQKNIQDPYDVKFDLSEVTNVSSIVQSYYEQQEQQNTIKNQIKYNAELARRNYLFSREFHDNVFDGEGYFDMENIKPLSIETKMMSLGSRLQQFGLPGVSFQIQNNNALSNTAGKIAHQTINPTGIREWNIASNTVIGITSAFNYIYIKCQKVGTNASFVVTEAQIKVEADPDFYHFEVGYLSSVIDGYRKIKTTYGFAQLNPAELSIGKISDPTGNNYIELLQDKIAIKAKVEFTNDSPAIDQIGNAIVVGARNLALNSKEYIDSNNQWLRDFVLSEPLKSGNEYVIKIWLKAVQNNNAYFTIGDQDGFLVNLEKTFSSVSNNEFLGKIKMPRNSNGQLVLQRAPNDNSWYQFEKLKIEKGNKATDWTPAPEDVQEQITDAENAAITANQLLADIANDDKLTPSEKQLLKREYDLIIAEKPQLQAQANTYAVNVTTYLNAYNTLVLYTNPLLLNLNTTVDIVGDVLRNNFNVYYTEKVNLLKAITDRIDNFFDDVYGEMNSIRTDLSAEINDVSNSINNLSTYVDGAFSDGIISATEAVAIEKYINQLSTEQSDLSEKYTSIYNDINLIGGAKTELSAAWGTLAASGTGYLGSYKRLISSISTAIADGMTTSAEKLDVDLKFSQYKDALTLLTSKFQNAITAIENKKIENIQVGGRNYYNKTIILENDGLLTRTENDFKIIGKSSGNSQIRFKKVINSDGYWTVSGFVKNTFGENLTFKVADFSNPYQSFSFVGDGEWKRFEMTFNIQGYSNSLNFLDFAGIANSEYIFEKIKIEKGNKSTDWTPAPEDVQAQIDTNTINTATALAQANNAINTANNVANITDFITKTTIHGNTVATGTLLVGDVLGANAMISGVTDRPNGESIRFAAGKPYSQKYLSPFQVLDNGMIRFVNPLTGQKTFELGFNQNTGKVVFDIYNDSGIKVASIGSQGIIFTGYVPESYKKYNLRKLITTSFIKSDIESEMQNKLTKFLIGQAPQPITPDNNWRQYNIGSVTNYTAYSYYEGRNFESADNAQYAGFYPTANKFDSHIPNGIYVKQFILENQYTGNLNGNPINPGDSVNYPTEAWKIEDGKIVGSIIIYINTPISSTATRSTDFPIEDYE